jgi:uncharacterized protein YjbJ (UPF0337 family)
MNKDVLKGKWKKFSGAAKQQWGRLTDDDLDRSAGDAEQLEGILQERYGYRAEEAKKEVEDWMSSLDQQLK